MRAMATAKKQIQQMLETLPDDVSFEDIQYHIYVRQQVQRGLDDEAAGRVVSHEEAQQRLAKWTTK
jgi:predicted transcriptional regulator